MTCDICNEALPATGFAGNVGVCVGKGGRQFEPSPRSGVQLCVSCWNRVFAGMWLPLVVVEVAKAGEANRRMFGRYCPFCASGDPGETGFVQAKVGLPVGETSFAWIEAHRECLGGKGKLARQELPKAASVRHLGRDTWMMKHSSWGFPRD